MHAMGEGRTCCSICVAITILQKVFIISSMYVHVVGEGRTCCVHQEKNCVEQVLSLHLYMDSGIQLRQADLHRKSCCYLLGLLGSPNSH